MIIRQCQYTTSPASLCHAHSCHTELHPSSRRMSGEMVTRIKLTALHDTVHVGIIRMSLSQPIRIFTRPYQSGLKSTLR